MNSIADGDMCRGGAGFTSRLLGLLLLLMSGLCAAEDAVLLDAIRFAGNEVTKEEVLRQELLVQEGEPASAKLIARSRQAIMNLGLFKSVSAELLQEQGLNVLEFRVEERYYILPIPLLDYNPDFLADETNTNYSYGGELRFDNLFGLNQRLKISYEEKHFVDDAELPEEEWEIDFRYPRLIGTPYRLDIWSRKEEKGIQTTEDEQVVAVTRVNRLSGRVFVSRWLNTKGISEGWQAGSGLYLASSRYRNIEGDAGYRDSGEVALLGSIGYAKVDEYPYHRQGEVFDYSVAVSHDALGSDMEYWRNTFTWRRYQPLQAVDANINTQFKLGVGFGDGNPYSLGSSTSLRGYPADTIEGKVLLQGNMEYHHHVSGYRQMRGVLFVDLGNVWPALDEIDQTRLYSSAGVGMRWRVQSFVDVTLRADYAYNTDTGETETYLAASGSF